MELCCLRNHHLKYKTQISSPCTLKRLKTGQNVHVAANVQLKGKKICLAEAAYRGGD